MSKDVTITVIANIACLLKADKFSSDWHPGNVTRQSTHPLHQVNTMTKATEYVDHMYSLYEGRAAVTVGVNNESRSIHPFVYENKNHIPIGLIAMCASDIITPTEVDLYHISAFTPGKGQGSEIMDFLCKMADEYGVHLSIESNAQFNGNIIMNDAELASWYRKYGFKGNCLMRREPGEIHLSQAG